MAKDIKVIPSEECVPQHKLLICELQLKTPKPHPKPFSPKLCYWKLKEPTVQEEYERVFKIQDYIIQDSRLYFSTKITSTIRHTEFRYIINYYK